MRKTFFITAVLLTALLAAGCSNSTDEEGAPVPSQENETTPTGESETTSTLSDKEADIETIETYLENEFTGPGDALSEALDEYSRDRSKLDAFLKENYQPILAERFYEEFVNSNYAINWLTTAYGNGYQLQPKDMTIEKTDSEKGNAYTYEVEVQYSKDGASESEMVTGVINLNDEGNISAVRFMDDGGLKESLEDDSAQ
ncbi:hypothetical protein [Halobacillus litoralis]|uniref:hypothetical protein n=1 Tax=Halobacillus litoralis TaxID=45668 RepID=UPI001CFC5751|nr:hypothetical protein [Halobacillus litoralis]